MSTRFIEPLWGYYLKSIFIITLFTGCINEEKNYYEESRYGKIVFFANNEEFVLTDTFVNGSSDIIISSNSFSLVCNVDKASVNARLKISIPQGFVQSPKTYEIPNFIDEDSNIMQIYHSGENGISYKNSTCDREFQNGSNYGSIGEISISKINLETSTISGTFEMELCGRDFKYMQVEGYFIDYNFTY